MGSLYNPGELHGGPIEVRHSATLIGHFLNIGLRIKFSHYTERLFVRENHKNELYFSMISFQNEVNRVYVSEMNLVVYKWRN